MKREFTKDEKRWVKSLERCLKRKPESLEVVAYPASVTVFNSGAVAETFNNEGDMDNVEDYCECEYTILESIISGDSTI